MQQPLPLEAILTAGNYHEAKLLLEPMQPVILLGWLICSRHICSRLPFDCWARMKPLSFMNIWILSQQSLLSSLRSSNAEVVEEMSPDDRTAFSRNCLPRLFGNC